MSLHAHTKFFEALKWLFYFLCLHCHSFIFPKTYWKYNTTFLLLQKPQTVIVEWNSLNMELWEKEKFVHMLKVHKNWLIAFSIFSVNWNLRNIKGFVSGHFNEHFLWCSLHRCCRRWPCFRSGYNDWNCIYGWLLCCIASQIWDNPCTHWVAKW